MNNTLTTALAIEAVKTITTVTDTEGKIITTSGHSRIVGHYEDGDFGTCYYCCDADGRGVESYDVSKITEYIKNLK